jgi:hypothetical protein
MTPWIVLLAATVLFALALASGRRRDPPLPPGHDGERQLVELHALIVTRTGEGQPRSRVGLPGSSRGRRPHGSQQT